MTPMEAHPPPHGRFVVRTVKRADGWDLHIEGERLWGDQDVTQVESLDDAEAQVRNYLGSKYQADFAEAIVELVSY